MEVKCWSSWRKTILNACVLTAIAAGGGCASEAPDRGGGDDTHYPELKLWETNIRTGLTGKTGIGQVELYVITVRNEDTGQVAYDFKSKGGFGRFAQIVGDRTKRFPPAVYAVETRCLPGPTDISSAAEARALDTFNLRTALERDTNVRLVPG